MYIPLTGHLKPDSVLALAAGDGVSQALAHELATHHNAPFSMKLMSFLARRVFSRSLGASSTLLSHVTSLRKRASADNVNTTIGVVVGVLLAVFLAAAGAFLYFYGRSLRVNRRKNRRRRSSGSRGSKGEEGGGTGGDAPAGA